MAVKRGKGSERRIGSACSFVGVGVVVGDVVVGGGVVVVVAVGGVVVVGVHPVEHQHIIEVVVFERTYHAQVASKISLQNFHSLFVDIHIRMRLQLFDFFEARNGVDHMHVFIPNLGLV